MSDLVAFLTARLDEDEAVAKAAEDASSAAWWLNPNDEYDEWPASVCEEGTQYRVLLCDPPEGTHAARHDPARVLREVAADRRLLDLYERATRYRDLVFARPEPRSVSDEMRAVTQMMALEQVMRLRAARFSDHPDYDPAWSTV